MSKLISHFSKSMNRKTHQSNLCTEFTHLHKIPIWLMDFAIILEVCSSL